MLENLLENLLEYLLEYLLANLLANLLEYMLESMQLPGMPRLPVPHRMHVRRYFARLVCMVRQVCAHEQQSAYSVTLMFDAI